jgi:malonyl-CoA/methylmalonyl-CoA synthetase
MNHLFDSFRAGMGDPTGRLIETGDGRLITYGDALAGSGRLANVLTQLGVEPGDRVAVQVEKSPEALLLYLATIRAGAVFLPLNPDYTLSELRYFFGDAEPSLVVCAPGNQAAVAGIVNPGVKVETLGNRGDGSILARAVTASAEFPDAEAGPDDLAAILYTSGTTGRSKGAMLTHDNLASNARTLVACWRFAKDDVLVHALPIFHTHGLFVATNVILVAGASMLFLDRFNPAAVIRAMRRATVLMGVPTFYVRLLQQPELTRDAVAAMRLFISGSAPLLPETFNAWRDRTGHAILERYGLTETSMNASNPYDGERIAGTVGPALPGVDIRIVEPQGGAPLVRGEIGMIEVRGPNVFKGYWRMPEKTATEFRDNGFFSTGDLGLIDQRGYVHIVGRGKDLVISGGLNVYPKEVEGEIDQIPGVVESAVIGLPHPDFGEGVTAVVVKDVDSPLQEDTIVSALADKLARYKQPKRVLFIDQLPRNVMGKVQKNALRQQFAGLYE